MDKRCRSRIALVAHDPAIASEIVATLRAAGHDCRHYASGTTALRDIECDAFDCILIERALPDMDARALMTGLRARLGHALPVIGMARDIDGIVATLDEGADDCLPQPVAPSLLIAQINAAVRRAPSQDGLTKVAIGHLAFCPQGSSARVAGVVVQLTAKEYALALLFCRRIGEVLPRDEILQTIWGGDVPAATRTLDVHVSRLRTKLELQPERGFRLAALYGRGYRLDMVPAPETPPISRRRSTSPSAPPAAGRPQPGR